MPLRFSLREHDYLITHSPPITFPKPSPSTVAIQSGAGGGRGDGYAFINVPREWLNGKYLRFSSRSNVFWSFVAAVRIYDGSYDRSSDVDFPYNNPLLLKGNGLLQTIFSTSSGFGWTTRDTQVNVAAGSEDNCMICFYLRENQQFGDVIWHRIDWFEINSAAGGVGNLYNEQFTDSVTMEKTGSFGDYGYISTGDAIALELLDLAAGFDVGRDSVNLPAKFDSGQNSVELGAGFTVRQAGSQDFIAAFVVRGDGVVNLPAAMNITYPMDLMAKFRVEKTYDLRGTAGLAFYWWGATNPPEAMNQLILETPTGFWYSDFYDGSARLRYVFIPWSKFTWVSAEQRHLEPHRHGFNKPDKSQIDGILYTIHTTGVRRIDYIHAPFMKPFLGKFIVKQPGSTDFLAGFAIARPGSQDLPAGFAIRRPAAENLSSGFSVKQSSEELPSTFKLTTLEISLREHKSSSSWDPGWSFSKPSASIVRATATSGGLGASYMFFTVSKEYIHGKYIRITWQGDYTWYTWASRIYVFDGSYDRQSELDFPSGSGLLLKGNGLLQTGLSHSGDFGPVTEEFQVDVSGSALENVTIMIGSHDSWTMQAGVLQVDLLEINSAAAGVGTLWREPFNGDLTMERLGSTGDYGYIGFGQTSLGAAQDLMAGFNVGQDARDLAASFDGQAIQSLPSELTVRQPSSADFLGGFFVKQGIQDLPAKLTVRRLVSADLLGGFFVKQDIQDLPAGFTVNQTNASQELPGGFIVRQGAEGLAAKFSVGQDAMNLPAKMGVIGIETEDFEDATLVDHYQHYSGPGFRDSLFPHTGLYSWRTPQGFVDVFDISNGKALSYAKVTVWARYGNNTRKIELLDSAFNTLAQTTWDYISGYYQKSVEYTGPVKYFRITCPVSQGYSGLWTDDIEIKWA